MLVNDDGKFHIFAVVDLSQIPSLIINYRTNISGESVRGAFVASDR